MNAKLITQSALFQMIGSTLRVVIVLFKLRVVGLLLFAAIAGACLGANGVPAPEQLGVLVITGGAAAAGASALNQYFEREQDALMRRTAQRPLVRGDLAQPNRVLMIGTGFIVLPAVLVLPFNPLLAFFVGLGAVIYVGVYTLWLKPRTWLNIVIGGVAGSCAVWSGGAAVGAWTAPGVLALALLVFVWTPVHFWSLALWHRADYVAARVPMLPVVTTPRRVALSVFFHTVLCSAITLVLGFWQNHPLYWLLSLPATMLFVGLVGKLVVRPDQTSAKAVFHLSNLYLGVVLLATCLVAWQRG